MVVAFAGRRIDESDTGTKRFPLSLTGSVKRLIEYFELINMTQLVSSGACGADLLAMQAAEELMIRKTMILPFDPDIFRSTSVTDRPGDWELIYNRMINQLKGSDQLIILNYDKDAPDVYEKTNRHILNHALELTELENPNQADKKTVAVIVWEGRPKGGEDSTYQFIQEAQKRNFIVEEIMIIAETN